MELNEALTVFIKSNLRLLIEDPFPENVYKQAKKEFFGDLLKNRYKRPRNSRIASFAVDYMIRYNIIDDEIRLKKILETPFMSKYVQKKRITLYYEKVGLKRSSISLLDPERLRKADDIERVKSILRKEFIDEETEELMDAILKKQKEYYSVPSILDGEFFEEPEDDKSLIDLLQIDPYLPWWKKLNLISDPFPGEGLEKIEQNIYDKIIYKTVIFENYQKYVDDYPEALFKNTIFFGEFGSGKSTFFEYLQYVLIPQKIIPLPIILYGEDDLRGLTIRFRQKLIDELLNSCSYLNIPVNIESTIDDKYSDYLINSLIENGQKGIIIFIDNLHKNRNISPAMEFMNHIQSYSHELTRRKPSLNFAVFVAGALDWKKELRTPRYSGSFSRFVDMPTIDTKIAYETINMRLEAFSFNPENPRRIHTDAIERAYSQIRELGRPNTFRSFIQYIVSEFEKDNFDILIFNPFISQLIKDRMKSKFDNNKIIKARFEKLFYGSETYPGIRNVENIRKCLEQLVRVYLRGDVADDDEIIIDNKYEFQRISQSGLISKKIIGDKLFWTMSQDLFDLNKEIIGEFGLSIEDYLIPIYLDIITDISKTDIDKETKYTQIFGEIFSNIPSEISSILLDSINIRNKLSNTFDQIEQMSSLRMVGKRYDVRDKMILSIEQLTKVIALYKDIKYDNVPSFWKNYWYNPDNIIEYYRYIENIENINTSIKDTNSISYLYQIYKNAYDDIINFLERQITLSKSWTISHIGFTKEEIIEFQSIRENWFNNKYFECTRQTTEYMQQKLRKYISNIFILLYGNKYLNRIDPELRKYIETNILKDKKLEFNYSVNCFDYINRHDYKKIILETDSGKQNWAEIFQYVFTPKSKDVVKTYLDTLANLAIETDHLKTNSITDQQQNTVLTFILDTMYYIKKINQSYIDLLKYSYRIRDEEKTLIYFSFHELKDKSKLKEIYIGENANALYSRLESQKIYNRVPIDDQKYIQNYFDVDYRIFYAFISQMINISEDELKSYDIKGKVNIEQDSFEFLKINIIYEGIE